MNEETIRKQATNSKTHGEVLDEKLKRLDNQIERLNGLVEKARREVEPILRSALSSS